MDAKRDPDECAPANDLRTREHLAMESPARQDSHFDAADVFGPLLKFGRVIETEQPLFAFISRLKCTREAAVRSRVWSPATTRCRGYLPEKRCWVFLQASERVSMEQRHHTCVPHLRPAWTHRQRNVYPW